MIRQPPRATLTDTPVPYTTRFRSITFVVLYLLMAKVALPRVAGVLDERKKRLDHDLEEAARLKRETEQAIAEYEQALASARNKAQAIAGDARARMTAAAAAVRAKVEAAIGAPHRKSTRLNSSH